MEPDLDGLLEIAADALTERDRSQVLAWLSGAVAAPGHTERLARGERDVVILLPDRIQFVRPDSYDARSLPKDQVNAILFAAQHVQFDLIDADPVEFWIDTEHTPSAPFVAKAETWFTTGGTPNGWLNVALGLILVPAIMGLFYLVASPSPNTPGGGRLSGTSTCSEFLFASADEQLAALQRLLPGQDEDPAALEKQTQRCTQNGGATLDSLVGNR